MKRIRTVLAAACSISAAATLGIVSATGTASAARDAAASTRTSSTGASSTENTPACGTVPAGYATCLAWVRHRVGDEASSSPAGYPPATIEKAYGFASSDEGTGAGKTIALVDAYDDPTIAANLETFSEEYRLPTCTTTNGCFEKVNQTGGTSYPAETAGWDVEISLDVEWAHAIAPEAHILLVEASSDSYTNLFDAVKYAASHANYVSMSWGGTEFTGEKTFDKDFGSAGVSFFAAAGDKASEVIYPSASPDVVSVGGTTLDVTSTGAWKSESAWSTGGGGCSAVETANPSQAAYASYDQTGATCKGRRATPDVALDANPDTGVSIYDSIKTKEFGSGWEEVGGTSVATPIWAAHSAAAGDLVDAAFVYGPNIKFYDVTSGSNGHTCVAGYNLCDGLGSWNTSDGKVNAAPTGSLSITSATTSLEAGASAELSVALSTSQTTSVAVTLGSSSTKGEFATTSEPTTFTKTLTLTVPAGSTHASFIYSDTVAGSPTLTASSSGWTSGTRSLTVTAGALATITVSPATVSLGAKATQTFTATGTDAYGNTVPASAFDPSWTTTVTGGKLSSTSGATTVLTAGSTAGSGKVTATATSDGTIVSGHAAVTVTSTPTLAVSVTAGSLTQRGRTSEVPLTVKVTGTSGGVKGAKVSLDVYSGTCSGSLAASGSGTTASGGSASFTFSTTSTGTYCAKATATASGYDSGSGTVSFSITASTRGVRSVRA